MIEKKKKKIKNVTKTVFVAAFAAGLTLFSCNNPKQQGTTTGKDTVSVVIEDENKAAVKDFTVYTYAEKDKALTDANAELDRLNQQIDDMKADFKEKSNDLSAEAKAKYEKSIAAFEKEKDEFKIEVDKIQNSTEENWEQLKKDVNRTYNKVATSVEKGWGSFKERVKDVMKDVEKKLD